MKRKLLYAALLSIGTTAAHADPYLIAGFGKSILKEAPKDNTWHQNGFSDYAEQQSNAWKIGVGLKLNRYFDAELDYRDLGQFNQMSGYVSDLGGPGSYNGATKSCNGECEPTSVSFQHGTTKGMGFSLVMHPDWEIAPFLRLGTFYHFSNYYSAQKYGTLPYQKQFTVYHQNAEAPDYQTPFRHEGFGAMVGGGIRAGMFEVEYTYYPKVQSWCAPYQDVFSVMLAVRFDL